MRTSIILLSVLCFNIATVIGQKTKLQAGNPFGKLGYDVLVATSSKGEFTEFHDQKEIVEIGSVLYNTKTKKIIKILDKDSTTIDISSATAAMSIDPLCEKYYWISPYVYCANNPIKFVDPDGRDVIVLNSTSGAKGAGHQAILIGNKEKGWFYLSKDGSASGGPVGDSRYTSQYFASVEDFANSNHNFRAADGEFHSNIGGGENKDVKLATDENGNKIQRYDKASFIKTDGKDGKGLIQGLKELKKSYILTISDCSDIVTKVLDNVVDPNGNKIKNGEGKTILDEMPNRKQDKINERNNTINYDDELNPKN